MNKAISWNRRDGFPKLDEGEYTEKLTEIIKNNEIKFVELGMTIERVQKIPG